jgi:hypothetical protein
MPNKKISAYDAITTLVGADLFEVSQHVSGSTYTSKKISVTDMLTVFAGVTDHGALTGLSDNDHPQYLLVSNVNDTTEAALAATPNATGGVVLFGGSAGALGVTSLAVNGATIGSNALAVTGTTSLGGSVALSTTNTHDIGDATTYLRRAYAGDFRAISSLSINNAFFLTAPSDGVVRITNAATSDFNRLQFGGTTSSFPSLKRSATTLIARLADDSADAGFKCLTLDCPTIAPSGGATSITGTLAVSTSVNVNSGSVVLDVNGSRVGVGQYIGWLTRAHLSSPTDTSMRLSDASLVYYTNLTINSSGLTIAPSVAATSITGTLAVSSTISPGTFTVATLPTVGTARRMAYASNGRKAGEGGGAGTGVIVFDDGTNWIAVDTGAAVAA